MKQILIAPTFIRFLPHWLYFKTAKNRDVMTLDFKRNLKLFRKTETISFMAFCDILTFHKEIRNIYYARVAKHNRLFSKILAILASPQPLLDISSTAPIGGGG